MKLRILQPKWAVFTAELCRRKDVETAGIIFAERLNGASVLLVRRAFQIPDECYDIRLADQIRINPIALNRLLRPARDAGWSVITVHTHPNANLPWFSQADDMGDSRLMPSLYAQMSGPHGSIVVAGDTAIPLGRVFHENGAREDLQFRVVGRTLSFPHLSEGPLDNNGVFDRQRIALGADGQRKIRDLHVGVVGLGGTGSIVFAQLVHLGVRQITIIDSDVVEHSNLSRIFGSTAADAGVTSKVDVAARYASRLGLDTKVEVIPRSLGSGVSTAALEDCDLVLSCVDRQTPRAVLNRFAYEKVVPLIDMGSAFRVGNQGQIVSGAGRVVIIGPGRRCLACWGHIDPARLRIESLSAADRAEEAAQGYIAGADVPQPSVMAFNTMIAGSAIIELLRIVTEFAGAPDSPMRLSFDFEAGTVRRNCLSASDTCTICSPAHA